MAKNSDDNSDGSVRSDGSDRSNSRRLRPSGGYRRLRSFQVATIIYDATVDFCVRFLDKRSRTVDQMIQAARSGRQNIAEGSCASATSSQTELRLVNVARASLEELLLDYEDFLRQRGCPQWGKNDAEAIAVRTVGRNRNSTEPDEALAYELWLGSPNPSTVANALICLIHQTNYLLDQQIFALERQFVNEGGYSEKLGAARLEKRRRSSTVECPQLTSAAAPACPACGNPMVVRTARRGYEAGAQFWGCSMYPACKSTLQV
jgi:restriction system protein